MFNEFSARNGAFIMLPTGALAKRRTDGSCCCSGCGCPPPCNSVFTNPIQSTEYRILPISHPSQIPHQIVSQAPAAFCCCGPPAQQSMWATEDILVYYIGQTTPGPLRYRYQLLTSYDGNTGQVQLTERTWDYGYNASGPATFNESQSQYPIIGGYCSGGNGNFNEFRGQFPTPTIPFACGSSQAGFTGLEGSAYSSCTVQTADYSYNTIMCAFPGLEAVKVVYKLRKFLNPNTQVCNPPSCTSACCLPEGRCRDGLTWSQCRALGGVMRLGRTCSTGKCDDPTDAGACCHPVTGGCVISKPEECEPPNVFHGVGSSCNPNPCPQPFGACCRGQQCTTATQLDCLGVGGQWLGPNSSCSPDPCKAAGGACCVHNGITWECYQVFSPGECSALGGYFTGSPDCGAINCADLYNGACCSPTSHGWFCTEVPLAACTAGTWLGPGTNCIGNPCGGGGGGLYSPPSPSSRIQVASVFDYFGPSGKPKQAGCSQCGAGSGTEGLLI